MQPDWNDAGDDSLTRLPRDVRARFNDAERRMRRQRFRRALAAWLIIAVATGACILGVRWVLGQ